MTIHVHEDLCSGHNGALAVKPAEAARLLGMSKSWLNQLRMRGKGPKYVRLNNRVVLYRIRDLEAYLAGEAKA